MKILKEKNHHTFTEDATKQVDDPSKGSKVFLFS
jgi:hypothetical protein